MLKNIRVNAIGGHSDRSFFYLNLHMCALHIPL
nr:MAG TPA: hypothetical protein [Caudoviricetes sp.]